MRWSLASPLFCETPCFAIGRTLYQPLGACQVSRGSLYHHCCVTPVHAQTPRRTPGRDSAAHRRRGDRVSPDDRPRCNDDQQDRRTRFFLNDAAPPELYTLSLPDALPPCPG